MDLYKVVCGYGRGTFAVYNSINQQRVSINLMAMSHADARTKAKSKFKERYPLIEAGPCVLSVRKVKK